MDKNLARQKETLQYLTSPGRNSSHLGEEFLPYAALWLEDLGGMRGMMRREAGPRGDSERRGAWAG